MTTNYGGSFVSSYKHYHHPPSRTVKLFCSEDGGVKRTCGKTYPVSPPSRCAIRGTGANETIIIVAKNMDNYCMPTFLAFSYVR